MRNRPTGIVVFLFLITAVTKLTAFVLTLLFAFLFGANIHTDAYYAGRLIPDFLNTTLAICALELFIPVYIKCEAERGKSEAERFVSNTFNSTILFNICLFIVVCAGSPLLVRLAAPGFSDEGISETVKMICLLSMTFPFTVGTYVLSKYLNAVNRILVPALFTLLNHLCVLLLLFAFAPIYGIFSYPFICVAAWGVQLVAVYIYTYNTSIAIKPCVDLSDSYLRSMVRDAVPMMIAVAVDQIGLAVDRVIGSSLTVGSVSVLGYSQQIYNAVNGLISGVLITVYYPVISRNYFGKDREALFISFIRYLEAAWMMTLPLFIMVIYNAKEIIQILFGKSMDIGILTDLTTVFVVYMIGLVFVPIRELITRLFYIRGNTIGPASVSSGCVLLNILLSLYLKERMGILGIAIGTTVSLAVCTAVEMMIFVMPNKGIGIIPYMKLIDARLILTTICANCTGFFSMILLKRGLTSCDVSNLTVAAVCSLSYVCLFGLCMILLYRKH